MWDGVEKVDLFEKMFFLSGSYTVYGHYDTLTDMILKVKKEGGGGGGELSEKILD